MIGKSIAPLPQSYAAAQLDAPSAPLQIRQLAITGLNPNEVWVKMLAAPINPADLAMLAGTYPHLKKYPFVPGLEGCGRVVASGGGFLANRLVGKTVACTPTETGNGTWAAYMKVPAAKCVVLHKSLSIEQGATALVNPLTALALLKRVKQKGGCFVHTAAASALGQMLRTLAKRETIEVINIVRSTQQEAALRAAGARLVFNSSDADFASRYAEACSAHGVRVILDAVGGSFTNTLLSGAAAGTELIAYASLSRENISISSQHIIRENKKITGFHLGTWLAEQPLYKKLLLVNQAQKLMASGIIQTPVHTRFTLEEINTAIASYQKNMSAGKWLLRF